VIAYLLALSRDLPGWFRAQRERKWEPRIIGDLQGRVLGVVGLGPIGREVARLGAALGMRVVGLRRTPCGDEPCETWPMERLHDLLAGADAVVLALPLTADTRHLIGTDALARLKPDAVIVNVGRGELIDEAALIEALVARRIGGAALDVFETEPLPSDSPLWDLPNVIITAHSAGHNPANSERATGIFIENLARYLNRQPLRNEVGA
jgi:phosphoglycerate dehydrogenase-like enzyme